jgi:hypothetical protein
VEFGGLGAGDEMKLYTHNWVTRSQRAKLLKTWTIKRPRSERSLFYNTDSWHYKGYHAIAKRELGRYRDKQAVMWVASESDWISLK